MASIAEEKINPITGITHPGFTKKDALTTFFEVFKNPTINGTICKENQDSIFYIILKLKNETEVTLMIVCDGHGASYGHICSQFVIKFLSDNILKKLDSSSDLNDKDYISKILESTFIESHHHLLTHLNKEIPYSKIEDGKLKDTLTNKYILGGTTASVALIINDFLFVANCGDSEILLLQPNDKPLQLTTDHDPMSLDEYRRIKKGVADGNFIPGLKFLFTYPHIYPNKHIRDESEKIINKPYSYKNVRNEPGTIVKTNNIAALAFCRTIGDFYLQEYGVICTPSINIYNVATIPEGSYLFAMSDGVGDNWEYEDIYKSIFSDHKTIDDKLYTLMLENLGKSWDHFRSNMDNQSGILFQF